MSSLRALVDEETTDGTVSITVLATGFKDDGKQLIMGSSNSMNNKGNDFPEFLGGTKNSRR